jgi:hypothetical protein
MQDDQIGSKIVVLTPADMARLPPSVIPTKKILVVYNLVCQLGLYVRTLNQIILLDFYALATLHSYDHSYVYIHI